MERIVREHGGLSPDQAVIVVHMAKTHNLLFGGTENYLVTREFNRLASVEEKKHLLDCLFAVSAADSRITGPEDKVIRQIADELLLEHRDNVRAEFAIEVGVKQFAVEMFIHYVHFAFRSGMTLGGVATLSNWCSLKASRARLIRLVTVPVGMLSGMETSP